MSWRFLLIEEGTQLFIRSHQLIGIRGGIENTASFEDIALIVIESGVSITSNVLSTCADNGVSVLFCNPKKMPSGFLYSITNHSRNLSIAEQQIACSEAFKGRLWQSVVKQKIYNQYLVLEKYRPEESYRLHALINNVKKGDSLHCEGTASQIYFPLLFGDSFIREGHRVQNPTYINSLLNFGYAVFRAKVASTIVSYGLLPQFGIFHKNALNPYNLADDLLEPFRPVIDSFVKNKIDITPHENKIDTHVKKEIILLLQNQMTIGNQSTSIIYAISVVVESLVRAIKAKESTLFQLPMLIK